MYIKICSKYKIATLSMNDKLKPNITVTDFQNLFISQIRE